MNAQQTLVVIESPGKRKTLEKILGPGYRVVASFGHIRDLPEKGIGVDPPDFVPQYALRDDHKKAITELRAAAANASRVLLATDADREGEAIAWHIAEVLKLKTRERITYREITHAAVHEAVNNPRAIDVHLVHAQEARRTLDRLVGFMVSPALTDSIGANSSAGRVQSVALRIAVERERAIQAFKPVAHYGARIHFADPTEWFAGWTPQLPEGTDYALDKHAADAAAAVKHVIVRGSTDSTAKRAPPPPFTTSTIQLEAQRALKFKPKTTMELAQALYEQGAITYMRTDSMNLADEAIAQITAYANEHELPLAEKRRTWKAKGNAQEAHEAIRPAHIENTTAGETADEQALYRLIWTRTIATQLAEATYDVRVVELESVGTPAPITFTARGRILKTPGWTNVYAEPDEKDDDDDDSATNQVPPLQVGQTLNVSRGSVQAKKTKPPPRFTLATLQKELGAHGVGRPSTWVAILENIMKRDYIAEDKKDKISATNAGMQIVDSMVGRFTFMEVPYTRDVEQELDEVAAGNAAYLDVVSNVHKQLSAELQGLSGSIKFPCASCGRPMRQRNGASGLFWGCTGYPDCKQTAQDDNGKPRPPGAPGATTVSQARPTKPALPHSEHACGKCGKPLIYREVTKEQDPKKKGYRMFGCSGFPATCKQTYNVGADGSPMYPTPGGTP